MHRVLSKVLPWKTQPWLPAAWQGLGAVPAGGKIYPKDRIPGRMFSMQQSLPRLPVQPLEHTLDKLLNTSKPLFNESEFQILNELVKDFKNENGPEIHRLLEQRAKTCENWLSDWWLNVAYLEWRMPCPIHVNPGISVERQPFRDVEGQIKGAAKLMSGILDFKSMIDEQSVPIEYMGKDPLCMKQYYTILNTCRVPGHKKDSITTHTPSHSNAKSAATHIIVAHNNQFFKVEVYGRDGKILNVDQIEDQLSKVVSASPTPGPKVGILTTDNRDRWAVNYDELMKDPQNAASHKEIQSAITMLCLDGPTNLPNDSSELLSSITGHIHNGLGSKVHSANRWFDKTTQFIVGREGQVGLNYEHGPAEGPPILFLMDHMMDYLYDMKQPVSEAATGVLDPVPLPFNVTPTLEKMIDVASDSFDADVKDLDIQSFTFSDFGKDFPKSQKMSPDAFIQVAFQLAYYRLTGHNTATYESGSLRRFQLGRTDTIRSCSQASDAYVKAMTNPESTITERVKLLKDAVVSHRSYSTDVVQGKGIDRHMLGYKLIAKENGIPTPKLFEHPLYSTIFNFRLSTSQVPARHNAVLAFGPVVPEGYGICYNPMKDKINFSVSTWNSCPTTNTSRMIDGITEAMQDAYTILAKSQQSKI